jgi:hypothetical protein
MKKSDVKFYSNVLINADIDFLLYQATKRNVTLKPGTGIQKLIDECRHYISLPTEAEILNTTVKPLLVLYTLADTLRMLWMKRKSFGVQLASLNAGTYEYGVKSNEGEHYFKDFEFELFTAAYLNEFGVQAELPQHTAGNDIMYKDIEIQCKHPDGLSRNKIDKFLRAFQSSLNTNNKYGVFGIAVDDYLGFTDEKFPIDYEGFERAYRKVLLEQDKLMQEIFNSTLPFCPRVLGVFIANTHFSFNDKMGLSLMKTTNSVFCIRPKAKEVPEESHIQAYEVLSVFNNKPAIVSY